MTFYDRAGVPTAYIEDGENIVLFSGKPVAYLAGEYIYTFGGRQLGIFEDGWVRDIKGYAVFFTDEASGCGPVKPVKCVEPVRGVKQVFPVKGVPQVPYVKSVPVLAWSHLSGKQFFY